MSEDLVQATSLDDLSPNGQLHAEEYELCFGDGVWRTASRAAFIVAERRAGFRPKMDRDDPRYMDTLATSGFSGNNIEGRIKPASPESQGDRPVAPHDGDQREPS